jgi:Rab-like protein 2
MCVQVTQKSFKFAEKHGCPFFFVSASDGTNVVRIFNEAILQGAQPGTKDGVRLAIAF